MNRKTTVCALGCAGFLALCMYFISNGNIDGCTISIFISILCFALGMAFEGRD